MNGIAGKTGPEHFLAGEDKLSRASHLDPRDEEDARLHAGMVAEAQAHFAAAQALAFAVLMALDSDDDHIADGWSRLLGIKQDDVDAASAQAVVIQAVGE